MHLTIYLSDYTGSPSTITSDLADITKVSKRNNPRSDITGVLFFHENQFLQVIEGAPGDIETLRQRLEKDSRHANIRYLVDEAVTERGFGDWNMDSFHVDGSQSWDFETMQRLGDACQKAFKTRSDILVDLYRDFSAKGLF